MTDTPKTESAKPTTERPRPSHALVQREGDKLIDFEPFTGETAARRALDDASIDAGWRYVQIEPGRTYLDALKAARS